MKKLIIILFVLISGCAFGQAGSKEKFGIYSSQTQIGIKDISAPTTPLSGYGWIYTRNDSLRFKNDAGTEFTLGLGGAGGYTTLAQFVGETNWQNYYSNGSGDITGQTVGAANTVWLGNGVTSAPTWGTVPNAALTNSTISGISLGSNLNDLTATNSTLTFSGAYNGGTARTIGINLSNANTWAADQSVPDEAYDATAWNGSVEVPTKNAIRDKVESMSAGSGHTIEEDGTPLTARTGLNFVGAGFTAADDAGNDETDITLDTDLNDIAGLTATTDNFLVSVSSAWASRTPSQVRTTLALVIGTNVQAWDADLDALAGMGDGIAARTGAGTYSPRTITGTSNEITITNGSGVSGNPTVALSSTLALTSKNVQMGNILDANNNELISFQSAGSAVNHVVIANGATGNAPRITGSGDNTNVDLEFEYKAAGKFKFLGTSSGEAEIRLFEDTDNGSNYNGIIAQANLASSFTATLPAATGTLLLNDNTATVTNKRVQARTGTTTSSATPTINTDNVDIYYITAQTVDITSMTTNLSGTPVQGERLSIWITGTASRAITWGASFTATTIALPTTTSGTATLKVFFIRGASTWEMAGYN